MTTLLANPLTESAFEPFGQVFTLGQPGVHRREPAALLANLRQAATPTLAVARIAAVETPLKIDQLERHLYSSQTFMPTDLDGYLVVVCPSDNGGEPLFEQLTAFVAAHNQAVNYAAGTWHYAMSPLARAGEYVVLRWNDGSDTDVELRALTTETWVQPAGSHT